MPLALRRLPQHSHGRQQRSNLTAGPKFQPGHQQAVWPGTNCTTSLPQIPHPKLEKTEAIQHRGVVNIKHAWHHAADLGCAQQASDALSSPSVLPFSLESLGERAQIFFHDDISGDNFQPSFSALTSLPYFRSRVLMTH